MRVILVLLLGSGLLVGCKHAKPSDPANAGSETVVKKSAEKESSRTKSASSRETGTAARKATALNEPSGKIASVNPNLRFVVIDFAFNPVPQPDQSLSVYRDGQKVGEVKISAQSRNNIIAADITAGDARIGDEVRP